MDLSKVKMVVTDMDGTLLNDWGEVSPEFFRLFAQFKKHGIHFVAASGRQYFSMLDKLYIIKDDITIVAENGGMTNHNGETISTSTIAQKQINRIIDTLRKTPDTYSVLCGKKSAYIETTDEKFIEILKEYYTHFEYVKDLKSVKNDAIFKVATYHFESSLTHIYPHIHHLEGENLVKISGENWLDISSPTTNKGAAIKHLQKLLNISKEETMAFGDYNNDIEMLEQASFSYAMENACEDVLKVAKFKTKSNNDNGVEFILDKLIKAKELA
ncbi:MAG: haloacid dehalogenase [Flavobacteriaceae bacterium]|nr:MAG: haloacid dehalogenase [Flavobacteriaceae bacterium]